MCVTFSGQLATFGAPLQIMIPQIAAHPMPKSWSEFKDNVEESP